MTMALAAAGSASLVLPSLSSSLLLHRKNARNSHSRAHLVASYGIPGYTAPRSCQTPGAAAAGTRPYETLSNPSFDDTRYLQRTYRVPLDCSTPGKYQTPTSCRAPHAYGKPEGGVVAEDAVEAKLDGGGEDGGGGLGDDGGGGSGGGRGDGSDGSQGEEGDEGAKKKSGLSTSQKLTLAYAILVGLGGIIGFAKSGSSKSLMAGGGSASILYYVFLNLPSNPVLASAIGLGISGLLLFIMGSRYLESGKVFPAGVVSLFSLVMTGGYVHGILRSAHH